LKDYASRFDILENFTLLLKTKHLNKINIDYIILISSKLLQGTDVDGLKEFYGIKDFNRLFKRAGTVFQFYLLMMEDFKKMPMIVDLSVLADVKVDFVDDKIDLTVITKPIPNKKKFLNSILKMNVESDGMIYVTSNYFVSKITEIGLSNFNLFITKLENELKTVYKNDNIKVLPIPTPLCIITEDSL
jgi:hypothetical protein